MLQTTRIKVGIHSEGSFGTSQDAPGDGAQQAECPTNFEDYAGQQLGFIVDYGDDGWNQGSPAYAGEQEQEHIRSLRREKTFSSYSTFI